MSQDRTPAPPLCPLEAELEALLQIELTEGLEETPMPLLTKRRRWLLLTDDECETLILALARGRHLGAFSEADAEILLDWANQARWHERVLRQVLSGDVGVDVREKAEESQRFIDRFGCGGVCGRRHEIVQIHLPKPMPKETVTP